MATVRTHKFNCKVCCVVSRSQIFKMESSKFSCIPLEHVGCSSSSRASAAACSCADAPRKWVCKTCKYEFTQVQAPHCCHVCPYLMSNTKTVKSGIRVECKWVYDVHDGYCSDAEDTTEVVENRTAVLPADVDQKQLSFLRWCIDDPGHCCCGAMQAWSEIKIVSEPSVE